MATYSNFYTVAVPAIGGTYSLPSNETWDSYILTSTTGAPLTVTGVIDIVPTGTIIEGLVYEIVYDGTLLGNNTFTVFGETIPQEMRHRKLLIKCIRIASSWVVTIDLLDNANNSLFTGRELQLTYSNDAPIQTVGTSYQDLVSIPYSQWYPENVGDVSIIKAVFNWDTPPAAEGANIYFYANGYPHPNSPTVNWISRFFGLPFDQVSCVIELTIQKLITNYTISLKQSLVEPLGLVFEDLITNTQETGLESNFAPGTPTVGTPLVIETVITDGTPTAKLQLSSITVMKGKKV